MPATQSIQVDLPTEMVALLHEAIESGEFTSSGQLFGEALIEWKLGRSGSSAKDFADLRRLWNQAMEAGSKSNYLELDDVFDPLLNKYTKQA
jgi:antitoxin ParD1/3/4